MAKTKQNAAHGSLAFFTMAAAMVLTFGGLILSLLSYGTGYYVFGEKNSILVLVFVIAALATGAGFLFLHHRYPQEEWPRIIPLMTIAFLVLAAVFHMGDRFEGIGICIVTDYDSGHGGEEAIYDSIGAAVCWGAAAVLAIVGCFDAGRTENSAPGGTASLLNGKKINGTNLGNWLVLEKWMKPDIFEETGTDDEIGLHRVLPSDELKAQLKAHRDTYITEEDFANIAAHGMNLVRLPVPYFVFGDHPNHPGCIDYVDKALDWAEEYGLKVLIDLHTVPGGQNGYDNGGLIGVCKWHKDLAAVEYALTVLEQLAGRYGQRKGLYGIEVLNEPISWLVYATAPSTGKAKNKNEASGSGYVPMKFLKSFYRAAYARLRPLLPPEKVIVFHDGFRLGSWGSFFVKNGMENVALDTHVYIDAMEMFMPVPALWIYKVFVAWNRHFIRRAARYTPVIIGEWNLENRRADRLAAGGATPDEQEKRRREGYRTVAAIEMEAWDSSLGKIYWNYQLERDHNGPRRTKANGDSLEGWDLVRTWQHGWMPEPEGGAIS